MKRTVYILLCLLPSLAGAQNSGVHFEQNLTWDQVKSKAQKENKYILVDCYATWCGPCKLMDQTVYINDTVGHVVNKDFISVKVQLDSTNKDGERERAWYANAHMLMSTYKVKVLPTYLFFSPSGKLVHRGIGYQNPKDFVHLVTDAQEPNKQYYVMISRYRSGLRDYVSMPILATLAKSFDNIALADSIAAEYLHGFLDTLTCTAFCTNLNLKFLVDFAEVFTSNDEVVQCILKHPELANAAMRDKKFAKRAITYFIFREEINPAIALAKDENKEPDWDIIGNNIKQKYGVALMEENVLNEQIRWYKAKKDWKKYTKYLVRYEDVTGLENTPNDIYGRGGLNIAAWDIFIYCDSKTELEKALTWSNWVIKHDPQPNGPDIDTKANLLYKLGEKKKALKLEAKAVAIEPDNKDIKMNYEKMRKSEPTW